MPSDHSTKRTSAKDAGAGDAAAASSTLWIGNLSANATDADVLAAFSAAGHPAVDCVTVRAGARGYAFAMFRGADEARAAMSAFAGKQIRGITVRIELSRPAKASRSLWVGGIGPSVVKHTLEEEFAKFGKIEHLEFSRERNSANIDYVKMEDAISAFRNMNGKVLDGVPLCIDFQRSPQSKMERFRGLDLAHSVPLGGEKPQWERRHNEQPSRVLWIGYPMTIKIDRDMLHNAMILFGEIESICFPSRNYALVEFRSIDEARRAKEGLEGRLFNDPRIQISFANSDIVPHRDDPSGKFHPQLPFGSKLPVLGNSLAEPSGSHLGKRVDVIDNHQSFRQTSPLAAGILPTPFLRRHISTMLPEPKRMRPDVYSPGASFDTGRAESPEYGFPPVDGVAVPRRISPAPRGFDHCWRGIVAKGGAEVCRARCIPIGRGIASPFPDVLNCSAKATLPRLTLHFADAIGHDTVFFLPDSEADFEPYTTFLRYLGERNIAAVAKFEDGTTLFLVPPSDFLTNVLNIDGRPRLYGVVLHLPRQPRPQPAGQLPRANLVEQDSSVTAEDEDEVFNPDYGRSYGEAHVHKSTGNRGTNAFSGEAQACPVSVGDASHQYAVTGSDNGKIALTPELLETIASLVSSKALPLPPSSSQMAPGPSTMLQPSREGLFHADSAPSQVLHYSAGNAQNSAQQYSNMYHPNGSNGQIYSAHNAVGHGLQDAVNMALPPSARTLNNHTVLPAYVHQQQHFVNNPLASQNGYVAAPTVDMPSVYNPASQQNVNIPTSANSRNHAAVWAPSVSAPALPPPAHKEVSAKAAFHQDLHPQAGPSGSAQVAGEEEDKNKRYQSTLLLAASLLQQIKQQPPSTDQ